MLLKGALHVHTTCSDGPLSIPEVATVQSELGFGLVAIKGDVLRNRCNDHDSNMTSTH
jgi:hypothetical protein